MKTILFIFVILNFICISEISAQNSNQRTARRNCSYVGRPMIEIGGGFVIGKALKLPKPRLSKKAKKLARNTLETVKVKIDENGKVIFAESENVNPLLQIPFEQAALKSEFAPTTSSGQRVTVEEKIIYKFKKGKVKIEVIPILESIEDKSKLIDPNYYKFLKMFDDKILTVINKSQTEKVENFGGFVADGQANIQICLSEKTPEIVERIKETGFELLEETQGNGLVGKIPAELLENLADFFEEIRRIVPEFQ